MTESKPDPDPTVLTTEALHREIAALKEFLVSQIDCVRVEALRSDAAITKLKEEKFAKVHQQFELVERARLEQKSDTKDRVDAALQAQKEAAAKSEQSFTKQIDGMRDLMESHAKASDEKIAALTVRVSVKDGSGAGMVQLWGFLIGAIGIAGVLVAIFKK